MKSVSEFGGFMIWNAGHDESNQINGKRYSNNLKDFFQSKFQSSYELRLFPVKKYNFQARKF